ncbi:MAG: HIT domain-containing protein [Deltaproteobacteria bacterium]|nr:HIT domain-containing protein [Deltaproteobacteria bacterium]
MVHEIYFNNRQKGRRLHLLYKTKGKKGQKNLILFRSEHCFVVMNLYPYNNGHLLIVPYKHMDSIDSLNNEEKLDLFIELIIDKNSLFDGVSIGKLPLCVNNNILN